MSLYETLKSAKLGAASDVYTTLRAQIAPFAKSGATEKELTDTLPLSFTGNGRPLIDWSIYGNTENGAHCGDRTPNLFNGYTIGIGINTTTGVQENDSQAATSDYIEINSADTYTLSGLDGNLRSFINAYNADNQSLGRTAATERTSLTFDSTSFTGGTPQGTGDIKYIRIKQYKANTSQPDITDINNYNTMLNTGGTAIPYEPYGYKLPVLCGGETTNIYLAAPLGASDSISMTDTGISIPTVNGSNTLSVGTTVQPSSVYIKYKE